MDVVERLWEYGEYIEVQQVYAQILRDTNHTVLERSFGASTGMF